MWYRSAAAWPARIGSLFLGNVAFYPVMRQEIGLIEHLRNVKFNWGTFYLPALKNGDAARRLGNSGASQGSQYLFIPKTTMDSGKLALALDLLQYISSPQSNAFWCKLQTIPCFKPGTPIEQIVPGNSVKQAHYRGIVDPPAADNQVSGLDVNYVFGPESAKQETAILRDYLADNATLDETLVKYQAFLDQQADIAIERHPDWGADKW